jgi:hypothetical protein
MSVVLRNGGRLNSTAAGIEVTVGAGILQRTIGCGTSRNGAGGGDSFHGSDPWGQCDPGQGVL